MTISLEEFKDYKFHMEQKIAMCVKESIREFYDNTGELPESIDVSAYTDILNKAVTVDVETKVNL